MKSDTRATNIDELRLKMEMFYQEIIRLQNAKAAPLPSPQTTQRTSRYVILDCLTIK